MPFFSKVLFRTLCFYKRPTLVPIFTDQKEFKEDFHFYKKKKKKEERKKPKVNTFQCLFCSKPLYRQPHQKWQE